MSFARIIKRLGVMVMVSALLLTAAGPARACLWDSDTLAQEAAGLPDVVDVIVGRFERQPDRYYEMRLKRVSERIEAEPTDLTAYDDAAVACDRLGRHDEAIRWMQRKKAQLDQLASKGRDVKEHRYRYYANLGTFHAHRWMSKGADRDDLTDLRRGRDLIAQAIELNPDAHFGREKYQLRALEWMLDPPVWKPIERDGEVERGRKFYSYPSILFGSHESSELLKMNSFGFPMKESREPPEGYEAAAVEGLSGLIVMGGAWRSPDVYHALMTALAEQGHASLALLARQRVKELLDDGERFLHPNAPTDTETMLGNLTSPVGLRDYQAAVVRDFYRRARRAAEQWHKNRVAFMSKRLAEERHPDTDPDFWSGYEAGPAMPAAPGWPRTLLQGVRWGNPSVIGVVVAFLLIVLAFWLARQIDLGRRRELDAKAAAEEEPAP